MQKFLQKISSKLTAVKFLLLAVGIMCSQGVWGQITSLPYSTNFSENDISPFVQESGTVSATTGTYLGTDNFVLAVKNGTAKAYFDSDTNENGNQPYILTTNETVTISFVAYQGYLTNNKTATIDVVNSKGNNLISYVYDLTQTKITNVRFNGINVEGFEAFDARSCNSKGTGFNGLGNYNTGDGTNNIKATFTIKQNGYVALNFLQSTKKTDKTYSSILSGVDMDIAYISISTNGNNDDRRYCIDNLEITSESTNESTVTFKYIDQNNNDLSSYKSDVIVYAEPGTSVEELISSSYKVSFKNNDESIRYDYSSYSCDYTTVPSENIIVYLTFNPKSRCIYTVQTSQGTILTDNMIGYEGDTYSVHYPHWELSSNGKLMKRNSTSNQYLYTVGPLEGNITETIEYSDAKVDGVIFCSEAENITTLTSETTDPNRASGGYVAYGTNAVIANLTPGKYKISAILQGANKSGTAYFKSGDTVLFELKQTGNPTSGTSEEFTILENTSITFTGGNSASASNAWGLDALYIQKLASPVIDAMVDCETYETSAAFKTYIEDLYNNGSLTTSDEVYAAHTAWQIAQAKANGSTDLTKVIRNAAVSDAEATDWNDASAISISQQYSGAPDGYFIDIYENTINTNQWVYGVPAGEYTIKAATRAAENVYGKLYVYSQAVGSDIASQDIIAAGNSGQTLDNGWNWTEMTFTVDATTNLLIGFYADASASGKWAGCDDWHMSIAGESVPVTAAGYATFSSAYALDLEHIVGGKAYIAKVQENGGTIKMTEWTSAVPANTGLLIKADTAPATVTIPVAADGTDPGSNYLKATNGTDVAAGNYVFAYKTSDYTDAGFYKLDTPTHIDAGKAYLDGAAVPSAGVKIKFSFDEDTATAISTVAEDAAKFDGATYNLAGQRVDASYKGIVIRNGKKFLVK